MKNSKRSRSSKKPAAAKGIIAAGWDIALVAAALSLLSAAAVWWIAAQGYTLYYGDAEAHLNTARRIVDSRTPGYDQLGTPWLPLPHLLMLPFIGTAAWWTSGLAGAFPAAACFVIAGLLFYGSVRMIFGSRAAAACAVALFALNPNILYLQAIPMTESVFFAGLCGILFCSVRFRFTQSWATVIGAGLFSLVASLTRYEGWFLIPFIALYFLVTAEERKLDKAALFGVIASLAPLYWLANNAYCCGDPLYFYHGPGSAKAIYESAVKQHMSRYAGDHEWRYAWLYYRSAAQLCAGTALAVIGMIGIAAALLKRAFWPLALLLLPCGFYVLSMYSSGTPIYVPHLWPVNSYYNTRYGLVAVLLFAFGGAAIVALSPGRIRGYLAVALAGIAIVPWIVYPRPEAWICWKESQVNSNARRDWTAQAARFLKEHYRPGQGIFTSFGDLTAIFREAGIPLRETLHDGNNPAWITAAARPNLLLHEEWAVGFAGDSVTTAVQRANRKSLRYRLVASIAVKGATVVEIYKRE